MDKKSKVLICAAMAIILIILLAIAIFTRFSSEAPGLTAYSDSGSTAQTIMGEYTWNSFLKTNMGDPIDFLNIEYSNENILLVKPGEKVTFRNYGKDFDNYKFYQNSIKYYNDKYEEVVVAEDNAPINAESKSLYFYVPEQEGTYIYCLSINYHNFGTAEYGLKIIVSNNPTYDTKTLVKYRNTYVGDASRVSQILNSLPYKEKKDGIILRTAQEPYELIVYYKNIQLDKEALLNNAVALFVLINNVDIVTFKLDDNSYIFTRAELQTVFGRDLKEYSDNAELWANDVFYHIRENGEENNFKLLKSVLKEVLKEVSSSLIVIDFDSFDNLKIKDLDKREILIELLDGSKSILEASNAEIRQRDNFKGILIYANSIEEIENGYVINIVKYQNSKKQEVLKYTVNNDGEIIEKE